MNGLIVTPDNAAKIRAGTKQQTRGIIELERPDEWVFDKIHPYAGHPDRYIKPGDLTAFFKHATDHKRSANSRARYRVGERLYIKEKFRAFDDGDVFYASTFLLPDGSISIPVHADDDPYDWRWTSARHMPERHALTFIEIENVRVQRVQDISEEDAKAEGVETEDFFNRLEFYDSVLAGPEAWGRPTEIGEFAALWDSIHSAGAWKRNDFVWAYAFRVVQP